jgi:periplasmic divalent cation tolerance protein
MMFIQIATATDSPEAAEKIASVLLADRLAACVQIVGPVASHYWWQGKVENAAEWLCLIKSERRLYERIEAAIRALHSYEVPEIAAVEIVAAGADYLSWLSGELVRDEPNQM